MILEIFIYAISTLLKFASPQSLDCFDVAPQWTCYSLSLNHMCRDLAHYQYMNSNCKKTCGFCSTTEQLPFAQPVINIDCKDKRHQCSSWKNHCHQESSYYNFMVSNCRKTCMFCSEDSCIDFHEKCSDYEKLGYCSTTNKYFAFMQDKCAYSCGFCKQTYYENTIKKDFKDAVKEFYCNFEINECDWTNEYFEDTADWKVGETKGGPRSNFNTSNSYLYLQTEYESYVGKLLLPWQLVLPDSNGDNGKMCLHLELQMSGGKVSLIQVENPSSENKNPIPRVIYLSEKIKKEWIDVQVTVNVNSRNNLLIVGTKGRPGTYIAIDNLFFVSGKC